MTDTEAASELRRSQTILDDWLVACSENGEPARNTVAAGIVVLDHLVRECPVAELDIFTTGGEVKGARSGLRAILERNRVPGTYLKEVTTRQASTYARSLLVRLDWGYRLATLAEGERIALLKSLITSLANVASKWLLRQNLKLDVDRRHDPSAWIHLIVESAKGHSGGVVEQHLVGAKLERRYPNFAVPNHPAHAADRQTARDGDYVVSGVVYHVTASPTSNVIQKCLDNMAHGARPVLLVPEEHVVRARFLAEEVHIEKCMTIVPIETFVALNIIEIATAENKDLIGVLREIVDIYNRRLREVETDLSLVIEVR